MSMEIGQLVFSKCGRDKGLPFVVLSVEGEYVFLADGQLRPLNKPKKKKAKHTMPTKTVMTAAVVGGNFFSAGTTFSPVITDADIRKWLLVFKRNEEVSNCLRTM